MREVVNADNVEKMLEDIQNHTLLQNRKTTKEKTNAKLVKLWTEDLDFRIRVMTHCKDRLSLNRPENPGDHFS